MIIPPLTPYSHRYGLRRVTSMFLREEVDLGNERNIQMIGNQSNNRVITKLSWGMYYVVPLPRCPLWQ